MGSTLHVKILVFKDQMHTVGIDTKDIAYIATKEEIEELIESCSNVTIELPHIDEMTVCGIRVIEKI